MSSNLFLVKQSSHFLQAHALLNLHIIHASQAPTGRTGAEGRNTNTGASQPNGNPNASNPETLHPNLGPASFKIFSQYALGHPLIPFGGATSGDLMPISGSSMSLDGPPDFSAMQLLKVMSRLSRPDTPYLPYFHLCRELGVRAVDGMVKGRVLDLKWTECVGGVGFAGAAARHTRDSTVVNSRPRTRSINTTQPLGSPLPPVNAPPENEEPDIVPLSDAEMGSLGALHSGTADMYYDEVMEVVGPKLVPMTPIMRYAMRDVVQEYEDDQSVSEYASLSDLDEY